MNESRRTNITKHRSRPIGKLTGRHSADRASVVISDDAEAYRQEYIDFINRLMYRMRMDGINRMLDKALEIVE